VGALQLLCSSFLCHGSVRMSIFTTNIIDVTLPTAQQVHTSTRKHDRAAGTSADGTCTKTTQGEYRGRDTAIRTATHMATAFGRQMTWDGAGARRAPFSRASSWATALRTRASSWATALQTINGIGREYCLRFCIYCRRFNRNGGPVVKAPNYCVVRKLWKKCGGTRELESLDWMSDVITWPLMEQE
jgi:hypothetical protein